MAKSRTSRPTTPRRSLDALAMMADCVTAESGALVRGPRYPAATIATVLSTSRRKASIVASRSASGVSSSLQCDSPFEEWRTSSRPA